MYNIGDRMEKLSGKKWFFILRFIFSRTKLVLKYELKMKKKKKKKKKKKENENVNE